MIATKTLVPERKLKIKFTSKRTDADVALGQSIIGKQISLNNECLLENASGLVSTKREPQWAVENVGQKEKRLKIDRGVTSQCLTILNKLMTHKAGWVFNQAVDPVALNIPDYFTLIVKPMDLGTIKSKLQKNAYNHADEFAADVRLTFSNAMLYNPPGNGVHKMALDLNQIFEQRWKILEAKCNGEGLKSGTGKSSCLPTKPAIHTPKRYEKAASFGGRSVSKRIPSKRPLSLALKICGSCGHIACRCSRSSETTHISSSDLSSDRSLERDHQICSADSRAKGLSTPSLKKSDSDSDVSILDAEKACSDAVTLVSDDASRQDETNQLDVPLSPQKALRAALLKCRFADTILKAQQKTLNLGDKNDPEKLKKERERLERRQREEKAKIEAEIRAAEAASREKAEIASKQQREREREAARLEIEKVERSVEMGMNLEALEELEIWSGYTPSFHLTNRDNGRGVLMASSWPVHYNRCPLEQLGFFIKPEYFGAIDEDDEATESRVGESRIGEEGEIFDTN